MTDTLFHPRTEALSALLARNWWTAAIRGAAAILFGLIALFAPGATILSLLILFAAVMLADGLLNLVAGLRSARRHERWGALILQGIASLAAAAVAILLPGPTVIAAVLLMAAWALFTGGVAIWAAVRLRPDHGRWWMGFGGALSIVGGLALAAAPALGAVVLTWWLGAFAAIYGASLLGLAIRLRSRHAGHAHGAAAHPA